MRSIFTAEKSFHDSWIGSPVLNRAGLHPLRIRAAHMMRDMRRRRQQCAAIDPVTDPVTDPVSEDSSQTSSQDALEYSAIADSLDRDGVVVIPEFLPQAQFLGVQAEARQVMLEAQALAPRTAGSQPGFQDKITRPFGFDRYDGGTLNRFVPIRPHDLPHSHAAMSDPRLEEAAVAITGRRWVPGKWWIYETMQGGDGAPRDPQSSLHRDTFFPDLKCWYFLEYVGLRDGPFTYVKGSHRPNSARLAWEQRQVMAMIRAGGTAATGLDGDDARAGSLRCGVDDLDAMGLDDPDIFQVAANTLVIANTFGFHRRLEAVAGARRLALYGHLRPRPFSPF